MNILGFRLITAFVSIAFFSTSCTTMEDYDSRYIGIGDFEMLNVPPDMQSILDECLMSGSLSACERLEERAERGDRIARLYVFYYSFNENIYEYFGGNLPIFVALSDYTQVQAFEGIAALADEGFAPAQSLAGKILLNATQSTPGVDADPRRAVAYLTSATSQGSMLAPLYLGVAYDEGRGVETSHEEATRSYELALERGQARAGAILAQRAIDGSVVSQDLDYAARQLVRSAELGFRPAIQALCEGEGTQIQIPMHPLLPEVETEYWCGELEALRESR